MQAATGIDRIAQANNAYVLLSWNTPPSTDYVVQFQVTYNQTGNPTPNHTVYSTGVSVKIPNLTPATSYTFQVSAMNSVGASSALSSALTIVTDSDTTAPAVPTAATVQIAMRGALLSWTGVTDADLQGYEIQTALSGQGFIPLSLGGPILTTTYFFAAPTGTPVATPISFQVRSVDWSGNRSAWSSTSTEVPSDGVFFDELQVGNLIATGTVTSGSLQAGTPGGAQWLIDSDSIRANDGTVTDYGRGEGVTVRIGSEGNAFFSGTISASIIESANVSAGNPYLKIDLASAHTLVVNDGTRNRFIAGDLSELGGVYSGTFGTATIDELGNIIADTAGLIKVVTFLGSSTNSSDFVVAGPSTIFTEANTSERVGFTVTRTSNLLVLASARLKTGNASDGAQAQLMMDGFQGPPVGVLDALFQSIEIPLEVSTFSTATYGEQFFTAAYVAGVDAGTHWINWSVESEGPGATTATLIAPYASIGVFLVGS